MKAEFGLDKMEILGNDLKDVDFKPFRGPVWNWFSNRGDSGLPTVTDLLASKDELEPYRIMSGVGLSPLTIRYRQVGQALELLYGKPLLGKTLDDLYNDWFRKRAYEGYKEAIEKRHPVYIRRSFASLRRNLGLYLLYLPCGGAQVTEFLTYIVPTDAAIKTREDWESLVKESPWY
jgi:hypothetical protein